MNEEFTIMLGLVAMYSIVHFIIIQFIKSWDKRNGYEKAITILGITMISLIILGLMAE